LCLSFFVSFFLCVFLSLFLFLVPLLFRLFRPHFIILHFVYLFAD
jgi:hypothetical protein